MNIPFKIYDFISVLFPGVFTIILIQFEFPAHFAHINWDISQLTIYFVLAYLLGTVIQQLARNLYSQINLLNLCKKFRLKISEIKNKKKIKQDRSNNESINNLRGRHGNYNISPALRQNISNAFYNYYSLNMDELLREEVFGLIYSAVQDNMNQRDNFTAIANMHRALAIITEIFLLYYLILFALTQDPILILKIIATVVVHILLVKGTDYFKGLSDIIPYLAFYRKYCERQRNCF